MQEIQKLFSNKELSVRKFEEAISSFPTEKQQHYYTRAYQIGFSEWTTLSKKHKILLRDLTKHNLQAFLDFLCNSTVLSEHRYLLEDKEEFIQLLSLLRKKKNNVKSSYLRLAFSVLLSFDLDLKIDSFRKYLRRATFSPEKLQEMKGRATIDTGQTVIRDK